MNKKRKQRCHVQSTHLQIRVFRFGSLLYWNKLFLHMFMVPNLFRNHFKNDEYIEELALPKPQELFQQKQSMSSADAEFASNILQLELLQNEIEEIRIELNQAFTDLQILSDELPGYNFENQIQFVGRYQEQMHQYQQLLTDRILELRQLVTDDDGSQEAPPASKAAVEGLVEVKVSKELLEAEIYSDCAICTERFELGKETKQLPCHHMYHPNCIKPWLALHNSCPLCRYELPTDDPVYESKRRRIR